MAQPTMACKVSHVPPLIYVEASDVFSSVVAFDFKFNFGFEPTYISTVPAKTIT